MKTGIVVAVVVIAVMALMLWPSVEDMPPLDAYGAPVAGGEYAAMIRWSRRERSERECQ